VELDNDGARWGGTGVMVDEVGSDRSRSCHTGRATAPFNRTPDGKPVTWSTGHTIASGGLH